MGVVGINYAWGPKDNPAKPHQSLSQNGYRASVCLCVPMYIYIYPAALGPKPSRLPFRFPLFYSL